MCLLLDVLFWRVSVHMSCRLGNRRASGFNPGLCTYANSPQEQEQHSAKDILAPLSNPC